MPYIQVTDRRKFSAKQIEKFENPGQLNFAFTDLINLYQKDKGLNYQTINDIIGALEGAKLEYYRRVAAPYENSKIALNTDVYGISNPDSNIDL